MPNFEDNLNFIFNIEYKSGSDFWKVKVGCLSTINRVEKIVSDLEKSDPRSGDPITGFEVAEKNKFEKYIKNLQKFLSTFKKKIGTMPEKIIWIKNEAEKLFKIAEQTENITDNLIQKSNILANKMKSTYCKLLLMQEILDFAEPNMLSVLKPANVLTPSRTLGILKNVLEETQEYNITRLKRAQEKFSKSKKLNDFMYGKRHPKLAHLLSLDGAVPVSVTDFSELKTPFGSVWVRRSGSDRSRMIYIISLDPRVERALKYDEMCASLDNIFESMKMADIHYKNDVIMGIVRPIISYISQPLDLAQHDTGTSPQANPESLFSNIKRSFSIASELMNPVQKEASAFLCGVLLLSESHEFRNPTGGKLERKAMKNVLKLVKNSCINPFSVVFCNAKGRYTPAKDKGGEKSDIFPGGQRQTSILIDLHKINVKYLCTNADYGKIIKCCDFFKTNYIKEVTKIIEDFKDKKETWKIRSPMLLSGKISAKFDKKNPHLKIYEEFCKGLAFINWLSTSTEKDTFDIEQLPNAPIDCLLTKIKMLTKTKNLKRVNKLLNNFL